MTVTYEPIATTTLASAAATITFSSISSAYTDLRIVLVGTSSAASYPGLQFNSDTATNYSNTQLRGNGTAISSAVNTNVSRIYLGTQTSMDTVIPTFYTTDIFSYAGSTYKTTLNTTSTDLNGSGSVERIVGLWRSTSAITSITITMGGATNFSIGTTATLYGIKAA